MRHGAEMSADLTIDLALLDEMTHSLSALRRDLAHGVDASRASSGLGLGVARARRALEAFGDDWALARGRMLESVEAVGSMAESTRDAFTAVEDDLRAQLGEGAAR